MKQLLATLLIAVAFSTQAADAEPAKPVKTKEVCKEVVGKDGKPVKDKKGAPVKQCKTIKVHKKHEGTEIPPKK
jgi:hypothetical protein